jgi:hypothetical protein
MLQLSAHPALARLVLLAHFGLFIVGAIRGPRLLKITSFNVGPPPTAPSYAAQAELRERFPSTAAQSAATMVLVESLRGQPLVAGNGSAGGGKGEFERFDASLRAALRAVYGPQLVYESFFTLTEQGLDELAARTLPGGSAGLIRLGVMDTYVARPLRRRADVDAGRAARFCSPPTPSPTWWTRRWTRSARACTCRERTFSWAPRARRCSRGTCAGRRSTTWCSSTA